ncbi:ferrochelatase [Sphingomonas sp.]|uniref:ferrochelatase n=1 Tax=Sphingomonas sp. TaxID=28214 RepID=UPI0025E03D96|nr:ferrochelatase [Sphingomonas sp.]
MDKPADHPPVAPPRIGVLLINLGTPDAATPVAVKRYLREFLSDRRVVELPPILWQPLLRGVVLNTRPAKSAHAYGQIWTDDGSPLDAITRAQARGLADSFGPVVTVDYAMRYGQPTIPDKLHALKAMGCERILIAPLYPQYSGATTGTVNDKAFATLAAMRWQPAIRTLPPYHDDPDYIAALAASISASLAELCFEPEVLVTSFHSMPEATLIKGDPYHCQCQKTARLLSAALGRDLVVSFQSKLGRAKWLGPPTEATLARVAGEGVKSVAVVTPGFSADNLETLEEIAIRGRETFMAAGGRDFACLPCLNDSEPGMAMLRKLLARELEGWSAPV